MRNLWQTIHFSKQRKRYISLFNFGILCFYWLCFFVCLGVFLYLVFWSFNIIFHFTIFLKSTSDQWKFNQMWFYPIQDGNFWGCSRMGGGQKAPHTLKSAIHILQWWNLTQLYLPKGDQKIYEPRDTPPTSAGISIFSPEISKLYYIKKYRYRLQFDT